MEHHADFAVPVTHRMWVETSVTRDGAGEPVAGWAIALGWWVDTAMSDSNESTGTLYLIVDQRGGAPVWVAEGNVRQARLEFD